MLYTFQPLLCLKIFNYAAIIDTGLASADISHTYVGKDASYWPRTFLHPGCFCLAYLLL